MYIRTSHSTRYRCFIRLYCGSLCFDALGKYDFLATSRVTCWGQRVFSILSPQQKTSKQTNWKLVRQKQLDTERPSPQCAILDLICQKPISSMNTDNLTDFRGPDLPENPTCVSLTVPRLKCHTVTTANVNKWRWGRVGNGQKPKLTNHRKDTKLWTF